MPNSKKMKVTSKTESNLKQKRPTAITKNMDISQNAFLPKLYVILQLTAALDCFACPKNSGGMAAHHCLGVGRPPTALSRAALDVVRRFFPLAKPGSEAGAFDVVLVDDGYGVVVAGVDLGEQCIDAAGAVGSVVVAVVVVDEAVHEDIAVDLGVEVAVVNETVVVVADVVVALALDLVSVVEAVAAAAGTVGVVGAAALVAVAAAPVVVAGAVVAVVAEEVLQHALHSPPSVGQYSERDPRLPFGRWELQASSRPLTWVENLELKELLSCEPELVCL